MVNRREAGERGSSRRRRIRGAIGGVGVMGQRRRDGTGGKGAGVGGKETDGKVERRGRRR